jgi:uncharacterized protein (TIGR02268 family)
VPSPSPGALLVLVWLTGPAALAQPAPPELYIPWFFGAGEALHAENDWLQRENEWLRAENGRLRGRRGAPATLTEWIVSGALPRSGVHVQDHSQRVQASAEARRLVQRIVTLRSTRQVAVLVDVEFPPGMAPWPLEGARLLDARGEDVGGAVWHEEHGEARDALCVVLETELKDSHEGGTFTFELWGPEGQRLRLGNLTFAPRERPLAELPEPGVRR